MRISGLSECFPRIHPARTCQIPEFVSEPLVRVVFVGGYLIDRVSGPVTWWCQVVREPCIGVA